MINISSTYCEDKSLPDENEMDRIDMLRLHIVSPSGYRRMVIFYIRCAGYRIVMAESGFVGPVRSCQTQYFQFAWLPSMTLMVDRFFVMGHAQVAGAIM